LQKSAEAPDFKELGPSLFVFKSAQEFEKKEVYKSVFFGKTQKSAQSTDVTWFSENNRMIKMLWEIGAKVKSRRIT
jgi:hypothetical protein